MINNSYCQPLVQNFANCLIVLFPSIHLAISRFATTGRKNGWLAEWKWRSILVCTNAPAIALTLASSCNQFYDDVFTWRMVSLNLVFSFYNCFQFLMNWAPSLFKSTFGQLWECCFPMMEIYCCRLQFICPHVTVLSLISHGIPLQWWWESIGKKKRLPCKLKFDLCSIKSSNCTRHDIRTHLMLHGLFTLSDRVCFLKSFTLVLCDTHILLLILIMHMRLAISSQWFLVQFDDWIEFQSNFNLQSSLV